MGHLRCCPKSLCLSFCRVWDLQELWTQSHTVPSTQAATQKACLAPKQLALRGTPQYALCGSVSSCFGGKDQISSSSSPAILVPWADVLKCNKLHGLALPFEMLPACFQLRFAKSIRFWPFLVSDFWVKMRKIGQVNENFLLWVSCKLDTYFLVIFVVERGRCLKNNSNKTCSCSFKGLFPKKLNSLALVVSALEAAEFHSCWNQQEVKTFQKSTA